MQPSKKKSNTSRNMNQVCSVFTSQGMKITIQLTMEYIKHVLWELKCLAKGLQLCLYKYTRFSDEHYCKGKRMKWIKNAIFINMRSLKTKFYCHCGQTCLEWSGFCNYFAINDALTSSFVLICFDITLLSKEVRVYTIVKIPQKYIYIKVEKRYYGIDTISIFISDCASF